MMPPSLRPAQLSHPGSAGCPVKTVSSRLESRSPQVIRVDLSSLDVRRPVQEALTENVSPHGARVVVSKPWMPNDRLNLRSLRGDFRARARVVYCEPVSLNSFALGLQLIATTGNWK
jgi:PilZ domain